jgi:aspartate aminotransferase-like enzyme
MIDPPRIMMMTGPVEVSPRVLRAMSTRVTHHARPEFGALYDEMLRNLQTIWKTKNDMVVLHGEGIVGVEASIASLVEPGGKVIISTPGVFGNWFAQLVETHQGVPVLVEGDLRRRTSVESVKETIENNSGASLLIAVHVETVCSVTNQIGEICRLAKVKGIPTAVDAIASIAGQEVLTDEWNVDLCIGTGQHCLSCPPGLTPVSVSQLAWEKMEKKKRPLRNSYLSILGMKDTWMKAKFFPYTPLVTEVYAMSEACKEILEEGLDRVFARHHSAAEAARKGLEGLGLELFVTDKRDAADTVTTFLLPEKIQDSKLLSALVTNHGVLLGGGYRELKGRIIRIGHSGYAATVPNVIASLVALGTELRALGCKCNPSDAVAAAVNV